MLLFETEYGCLFSIPDATLITAIRTAAVSGATMLALARKDSTRLAILGSGTQAEKHLGAMLTVSPIEEVCFWSRNTQCAHAFCECESQTIRKSKVTIDPASSAKGGRGKKLT